VTVKPTKQQEHKQAKESVNALRFLGGLLLMVALLLYFFHLAEKPWGRHTLGWLAVLFAVMGLGVLAIGWRKLRTLR
jgi:protein-S-isoprenylcysteine O-methyltransferase Ste14